MKIIKDVALELLLIDTQIKFVNEGLGHEVGCDQVLIHIARMRGREPKDLSSGIWRRCACRCPVAHGYISGMYWRPIHSMSVPI
jgi:hypothetical protein